MDEKIHELAKLHHW